MLRPSADIEEIAGETALDAIIRYAHRNYPRTDRSPRMAGETARDRQFSALKDPQYTGENRCLPCTVLNLAVAAAAAAAIGAVLGGTSSLGLLVAIGAFTSATSVIYLRGYLVPGTPTLTRQYLPERALSWFGKEMPAANESEGDGSDATTLDPDALFRRIGIVEEASDTDDLALDPTFEAEWIDAVDEFAGTTDELREQVATAAGLDPEGLELERHPGSFDAYYGDTLVARWESKAACQADVAAQAIMPLFDSEWGHRPYGARSELLGALRLFLEVCPTCRGRVSLSHEVVTSCCSSRDVVAATCEGCKARVFEVGIDLDDLGTDGAGDRIETP